MVSSLSRISIAISLNSFDTKSLPNFTNNGAARVSHFKMLMLVCRLLQVIDEEDLTVLVDLARLTMTLAAFVQPACQFRRPTNSHVTSSSERRLRKREGLVDLEILVGSLA